MVFNSDIFLFAFLPVVFTWFWLARSKRHRYVLLTVSGYVFYGYWDWRFCFLLLFSSLVSFTAGVMIERASGTRTRRNWMIASVSVDLALLGFFKYYNFLAGNLRALAPGFAPPILHIILPVGISFYTFHTISYIVDVYSRRIHAARNIFEYFAYVCLFSQLVAGPIVRFREIEDDLDRIDGPIRDDYMAKGLGFFAVGLVKKACVADLIARSINPMIAGYQSLSVIGAWAAAVGYTFQLYYDFSGYADMAVGLGYLFGLRIPQNFNAPYRAVGISDFWRRWHMSLSRFLRDYLYIPIGGSRISPTRTDINLMVTMLLGGLWHGAAWNFVVWGGYHGLLLVLERHFQPWLETVPVILRRALTFVLIIVGWVLFRATSLSMALSWLGRMAGIHTEHDGAAASLIGLLGLCLVVVNLLPETWEFPFGVRRRWAVLYAALLLLGYISMNGRNTVFLYYQF